MGLHLKRSIIIDFFGAPGCGKSTLSSELAKLLFNSGYNVSEFSRSIDNKKKYVRRCLKLSYFLSYFWKNPFLIIELFRIIPANEIGDKQEILKQIINIFYKLSFIKKSSKYDFIIFDEGIPQMIISLLYYTNNDNYIKPLLELITKQLSLPISYIYINASEDTVKDRLKKRDGQRSRIEKESDSSIRNKRLIHIEHLCNRLIVELNPIVINNNRGESSVSLARAIYQLLFAKIEENYEKEKI